MKRSLIALSAAATLLAASGAHAGSVFLGKPYIGAEFGSGHASLKDEQYNTGFDTHGNNTDASVYFGYAILKYLGVQINAGKNISTVSKSKDGYDGTAKLDNHESIYVRGTLPFQDRISLYGLAGYTRAQLEGTVKGNGYSGSYKKTKGSFSYGLGLQFYGNENTALTLAYTRLFDGKVDGVKVKYDVASIGLIHYFSWPRLAR